MHSHEVLRDAVGKVGVKTLAAELRLSTALVYKWCQECDGEDTDGSGARNPLDRVRDIFKLTAHIPIVGWLCHEADGFFVSNPRPRCSDRDSDLLANTQQMVQAFSKLLTDVSHSLADDAQISAPEADRIRASWEELKSAAESFVVACENGLYQHRVRHTP